jgi:hypothetical protein
MLALDFLGIPFSDDMQLSWQMALVSSPVVRQETGDPERLQELFQLQKGGIPSISKYISKDDSRRVIDRVPKPPLVFLLADETPHFINFRGRDFSNFNNDFAGMFAV